MNQSRKDKEGLIVKQDDLFRTVIETDVNLSRLPLFALTRRGLKTELVREWIFAETREKERVEFVWRIMATPQYGYPSPFAKKVHRAMEYLMTQNGFPIPEYLDFSLYEIANILGLKRTGDVYSGKVYADIKDALFSITSTSIESKGVFCYLDNGKKKYVHDMFHLYERVVFAGEILPDETIAEKNRVYFGDWYIKALNSLYVKPLDFPYWKSLRSGIACRLYEYLSLISFATKCRPFQIDYHRLCELLPSKPQKYFSLAKQVLSKAHQELMETGFLKKVVWRKAKTDARKWIIEYHFGARAKSELQRGFKDETYSPAILTVETAEIDEIEEIIESEEQVKGVKRHQQTPDEEVISMRGVSPSEGTENLPCSIAQELINRGITKSAAIDFAQYFPEEHIREKIEMHDVNKATGILTQNAAGWLREAITRDYQLSEEQKQKLSRLQEIKAQEEVKARLEEQAEEILEQRLKEALAHFPSQEEWVEERVAAHIRVREDIRKFDSTRPSFTEAEIEQYRQDYNENFPQTDDERRKWLIINDDKYNLRKIVSALSEQLEAKAEEPKETNGLPYFD